MFRQSEDMRYLKGLTRCEIFQNIKNLQLQLTHDLKYFAESARTIKSHMTNYSLTISCSKIQLV